MPQPLGGSFPPAVKVPLRDPEWWWPQAAAITLATAPHPTSEALTAWQRAAGRSPAAAPTDTASLERDFYRATVWEPCQAAGLIALDAGHVACCQFDAAAHHGLAAAVRLLQQVVRHAETGVLGDTTVTALCQALVAHGEAPVVYGMLLARRTLLAGLPDATRRDALAHLAQLCTAHLGADWLRPEDWALSLEAS